MGFSFLKKHYLLRCGDCPCLLNWIEALKLSVAKTASKNIEALICLIKFLSSDAALHSKNHPYSLAWNTVVISGLVLSVAT